MLTKKKIKYYEGIFAPLTQRFIRISSDFIKIRLLKKSGLIIMNFMKKTVNVQLSINLLITILELVGKDF